MARTTPTETSEGASRPSISLTAFKSSGLYVLDPYISPPTRDTSGQPVCGGVQPHTATGDARPRQSGLWTGHIAADNIGFRLLRKAGWSVGSGLGAGEQGRREPIEPVLPKGTRGLGFDSQAAQQQQQRRKRTAAEALDVPQQVDGNANADGSGQQHPRASARQRMASLAKAELESETLTDKVARHRQLMSADVEHRRGRAIERYLRSAFNDPFDHLHSDNSNPLSRAHKLTESNPLLDPIGD